MDCRLFWVLNGRGKAHWDVIPVSCPGLSQLSQIYGPWTDPDQSVVEVSGTRDEFFVWPASRIPEASTGVAVREYRNVATSGHPPQMRPITIGGRSWGGRSRSKAVVLVTHPEGKSQNRGFPSNHPETERTFLLVVGFYAGKESNYHLTFQWVPGTILGSSGQPD